MHQLAEVVGKRRQRREEENLKVDGRREEGRRRGANKGKIRRGLERRGGLGRLHHPLCGDNQLANQGENRKTHPSQNLKTLSHPPVTTTELGRPQPMKE